jgi:hypothetical protein
LCAVHIGCLDEGTTSTKNKPSPCYYCQQVLYQMKRHLLRKHRSEKEVEAANKIADKDEKAMAFRKIVNMGVFAFNVLSLKRNSGEFYVVRNSSKKHRVEDYVPCRCCLGFYIGAELYRHTKTCLFADNRRQTNLLTDGMQCWTMICIFVPIIVSLVLAI